jgi:hypothetical protein
MDRLTSLILATVLTVVAAAMHEDFQHHLERTSDTSDLNATSDLQVVVDDTERWLDAFPVRACYAEKWAFLRTGYSHMADGLKLWVIGNLAPAQRFIALAGTHQSLGLTRGHDC